MRYVCFLWVDKIHASPNTLEFVASNLSTVLVLFESFRFIICLSYFCLCVLQGATKILARQLIRLRQQIANLQGSRAQMRGIATHTQVDCQRSVCFWFFSFSFSSFSSASVHGALATFFLFAGNACPFVSCCGHERCHQGNASHE